MYPSMSTRARQPGSLPADENTALALDLFQMDEDSSHLHRPVAKLNALEIEVVAYIFNQKRA